MTKITLPTLVSAIARGLTDGKRFLTLFGLAAGLCALPPVQTAQANDSVARLDAGGIRLIQTYQIKLAREDLEISPSRIKIRYEFVNESESDQHLLVAFPVPPVDGDFMNNYGGEPSSNDNFLNFTVVSNGKPITPKVETKIEMNGIDFTKDVVAYGVPTNRFVENYYDIMNGLPAATKRALAAKKLITYYPKYNEMTVHWQIRTTLYWWQSFKAKSRTVIEHSYNPIPGSGFYNFDYGIPESKERYCMDDGFLRAARRLIQGQEYPQLSGDDVRYILTTANNWSGPIGEFRLVIDKEDPKALVSLCINGIRKIGPTRFEYTARNFVPKRELDILFLRRLPSN